MSLVGIDLGTAQIRAAIVGEGGVPVMLQHGDGAHAAPAVVAFDKGQARVGRAALSKAAMRPETAVRSVKRLLGRTRDEAIVAAIAEQAAFAIEASDGSIALCVGGARVRPEEVAAALLSYVADLAEQASGKRPDGAVLTAPYWFGPRQRKALSEAAERAGLRAAHVVSEGTAIALSLLAGESDKRNLAILDAGAGGCTASILEVSRDRVVLLASAGDPLGGGDDVDRTLVRAVIKGLAARLGPFQPDASVIEMVRQVCESMKKDLAVMDRATAVIPFLPVGPSGVRMQEVTLDRASFEPALRETIARVEAACKKALETARLAPSALSAVYATGGISNFPLVRAAVERTLGPITGRKLDADGAVALGAALQAGMLTGVVPTIPIVDVQTQVSIRPAPPAPHVSMAAMPVQSMAPPPSVSPRSRPSAAPSSTRAPPSIAPDQMRLELAGLLANIRAGAVTGGDSTAGARIRVRANQAIDEDDLLDPTARAEVVRRLAAIFKQVGLTLLAARQYRWEHPQTQRALDAALREIHEGLAATPRSIRFEFTTSALVHHGTVVWQPERAPLHDLPYQLFVDGLRVVQLKGGIDADELRALLGVLMRDGSTFGAEDDAVTALAEKALPHVAFAAVDAVVESDDPSFEQDRDALAEELARVASLDEGADVVLLVMASHRDAVERAALAAMPQATRARLAGELAPASDDGWVERFAPAFAAATEDAEKDGEADALFRALDGWSAAQVEGGAFDAPFLMLDGLAERLDLRAVMRLEAALAPPSRVGMVLDAIVGGAKAPEALLALIARRLERSSSPELFEAAVRALGSAPSALAAPVLAFVLKLAEGREPRLAELARTSAPDVATAVVARLAAVGTPQAREAIRAAFDSAHLEVRIAAIAQLPDAPAETVRGAMARLFEDPEPSVRVEALRVVERLGAVAVGPVLVRRVQAEAFHALPIDERRALLGTLAKLHPRRAEALAIELLGRHQLVPSAEIEASRALAAEALAGAASPEALAALEDASRLRPWNSKSVREAAGRAASAVTTRRSVPPARGGAE